MALVPIENVGAGGIISDFKPYQLQPNQWSSGRNVEFTDGSISKIDGYREVMESCPIEPWHLGVYQDFDLSGKQARDGFYWIAFGMEKIYVHNKGEWTDITRESGDYNTQEGSDWRVTQSGALLIATNGVDTPQLWPLDDQNKVSVDNKFEDMPSWIDPAKNTPGETDITCQSLSGFKNHIIATNILRNFDGNPVDEIQDRMIKWSTQHGHYAEPSTWDVTDKDQDAGEYELLDTPGPIVDAMPMGEVFMIYKTDSIYMMSYIGTPYIFSFKALDPDTGIIAKGAVAEFPGGHFFTSFADCYVNNGQQVTPILTGKVRDEMFNNLNGDHYDRIFCVTQPHYNEIWVCYPTSDSEYCDRAMVWNYKDNTFTFRDLPNITDAKLGVASIRDTALATWDDIDPDPSVPDVPWNSLTTMPWGTVAYQNVVSNLVMASPDKVKLFRDRAGQLNDTDTMYAFVERTGIDLGDPSAVKQLRAVWPKIETSGASIPMKVYTGYQMATDKPVTWDGPFTFDPDTQSKISVRATGKFLGIRFESQSDTSWTISGLELEYENSGRRGSRKYA